MVIGAPKGTVQVDELKVDPSDKKLLTKDSKPFGAAPYMVIQFQATSRREDWFQIHELKSAYDEIKAMVEKGSTAKDLDAGITMFRRKALFSPELLEDDAKRIAKKVADAVSAASPAGNAAFALKKRVLPELRKIKVY